VEACADLAANLKTIRALGCKAGVTLNPDTPASAIQPYLPMVDLVLVMMVHPGYSGQDFMGEVVPKILELRQMLDQIGSPAWLEVDGGISTATLPKAQQAGANAFVAAKSVFWNPVGVTTGIRELRQLLEDDSNQ
jgi:ribulose-phosphate 3-epimerase